MKKRLFLWLFVLVLTGEVLWGRIFFVGSNPHLSIIAFPQDLNLWERHSFSIGLSYQNLPWWGDVDEPNNRPNETYTTTEQHINFVRQPGDTENSYFQTHGMQHNMGVTMQYFLPLRNGLKTFWQVGYLPRLMTLNAQGNLRGETNGNIHYIPFRYDANHVINRLFLEGIVAGKYLQMPVGLKVSLSYENTGSLENSLSARVGGTPIESDRLFWGWTTVGCNRIFGYNHINGDAWFQDSYAIGPRWRWDFQGGINIDRARIGNRFRLLGALQQEHQWRIDTNATTLLQTNFHGRYVASPNLVKMDGWLNRAYANVTFIDGGMWQFNMLFFLGVDGSVTKRVLSNDLESRVGGETRSGGFLVEANPNVTIKPSQHMSMDIGLLLLGEWNRTERIDEHYNPHMRASRETWVNSHAFVGPEYPWEGFSYVDTTAFHVGFDAIFYIPLYGSRARQIGMVVNVLENTRFSWMTKYYGTNRFTAQETAFDVVTRRETFRTEIWFHTMIGVKYRQPPYQIRIEVAPPMLYSLHMSQRLESAHNDAVLFETRQSQNWAVQEGLSLRLTIGYEL